MATLHATDDGTPHRIYAKGSIEALLTRCRGSMNASGEIVPLDAEAILAEIDVGAGRHARSYASGEMPAHGHREQPLPANISMPNSFLWVCRR